MTTTTRSTLRRVPLAAAALTLTLGLIAGCGDDDDTDTADTVDSTEAPDETTTTEEPEETTTTDGGATTETTEGSEVEADEELADSTWASNATEFRGQEGDVIGYKCSAAGTTGSVWGSEVYTDDSSVCTAAVHAGLITVEDGGRVLIEIAPGLEQYASSTANGITTIEYASWEGSFFFPAAGDPELEEDGGSATAGGYG